MRMWKVAFVGAVLLLAGASAQDLRWIWVQGGAWTDEVRAIACAPDSSVYIAGFSSLGSDRAKFAVACLSSSGQRRWLDTLGGSVYNDDRATSVTVDVDGNAYATGALVGEGGTTYVAVVRIDTNGVRRWVTRYGGAYSAYVTGCQIVCGPDGNAYVAACVGDTTRRWLDFGVAGIAPDGHVRWSYRWPGPERTDEYADAIAIGANGHLCAVGWVTSRQWDADFMAVGLDTLGNERWTFGLASPGDDYATCVAVGADGSVHPAGVFGHSTQDLVVFGLSDSGTRRWCYSYDGPAHGADGACAIACGPDGNIYVAGTSDDSDHQTDMVVASLDTAGRERWVYRFDTTAAEEEHAATLVVSPDGHVYVAGYVVRLSGDSCDFAVVCLDTAGHEQWVYRYGTGMGYARACAVSVGPDQGACAAGWITRASTSHDMMVVSLKPASGVAELTGMPFVHTGVTIVRGVLVMPGVLQSSSQLSGCLLDASGRRVMALLPGPNDISHLSPGVYFIHSPIPGRHSQPATKVVIQR